MKILVFLVMLTVCAATPQDLSGKMFIFPEETNTAQVKIETSTENFSAVTICLRAFTDLARNHALFSLSTPSSANDFLIFKRTVADEIQLHIKNTFQNVRGLEYKPNTWHAVCATWDAVSGLGQLWLDGKSSVKRFFSSESNIMGTTVITLGQEQDNHGGGFDSKQSFVGMLADVNLWNYVLSPCEIHDYTDGLNFTPGNVVNWRALEFEIIGRVLLENKQVNCD
ncbi:serum amyloid P-component-like [Lampris incognitus]|uniref:serum amyloid P-component-like n=1 Tax=Lampris incognitus TaxID=2546036 RepID=UPI0024B51ED9|nr:serum amyloid P-component-like [Lampris incognitus]